MRLWLELATSTFPFAQNFIHCMIFYSHWFQTCVWPVKVVAFGLLTEVCDESLAIPFFITWRGKKHQKILPFLLEIFREENHLLGAKHTSSGLIQGEKLWINVLLIDENENQILFSSKIRFYKKIFSSFIIISKRIVLEKYEKTEKINKCNIIYFELK